MKTMYLTTALAACLALPAMAQDAASPFQTEAAGPSISASNVIGARIYVSEAAVDADAYNGVQEGWNDIGEVNDIILGRDGTVDAVLVDIGGFLGMGERQVAVDMAALKVVQDDATDADDWFLVLQTDRGTLEGAPEYMIPGAAATDAAPADAASTDPAVTAPATEGTADTGVAATASDVDGIRSAIERQPSALRLIHLRTEHLGPDQILVAAKIAFVPGLTIETLAVSIDEVEAAIRADVPAATLIYIEPDLYREKRQAALADTGLLAPHWPAVSCGPVPFSAESRYGYAVVRARNPARCCRTIRP